MKMKSRYSLNQNLTVEQFEELRYSGDINPAATYQDYLDLRQERAEMRRQAEAEAARLGYELKGPEPPDWTDEDQQIMENIWAEMARERAETKLAA